MRLNTSHVFAQSQNVVLISEKQGDRDHVSNEIKHDPCPLFYSFSARIVIGIISVAEISYF